MLGLKVNIMLKHCLAKIGAVAATLGFLTCLTSAQAANELKDATLSVYMFPIGSPSAFFKESPNEMYGVDIDVIKELQKRLGFDIKDGRIYPIPHTDGLAMLERNEIDILGGGLVYTKERLAKLDCTPIYINSGLGIVFSKKNHNKIRSIKDLKGLRIAVDPLSASGLHLKYVKQFGAEPVEISNITYALFMVAQGKVDALIYDRMPIEDFANSIEEASLETLSDEFGQDVGHYTFYLPKNGKYNKYLSQTLQEMLDDGTIDRLLKKWEIKEFTSDSSK